MSTRLASIFSWAPPTGKATGGYLPKCISRWAASGVGWLFEASLFLALYFASWLAKFGSLDTLIPSSLALLQTPGSGLN